MGVAGCGEYSPIEAGGSTASPTRNPTAGPSPTTSPSSTQAQNGGEGNAQAASYTFSLPPTDTSVSDNDGPAYGALMQGCDAAAQYLETTRDQRSYGFSNPRFAVIYAAGIALCRGDSGAARDLLGIALSTYGTSGLDRPGDPNKPGTSTEPVDPPRPPGHGEPECDIYRTLRSVLEQVAPDTISCPGDDRPVLATQFYETTDGFEVEVWDDPLTFDVDESRIPPENAVVTPTPTPTPTPTSTS